MTRMMLLLASLALALWPIAPGMAQLADERVSAQSTPSQVQEQVGSSVDPDYKLGSADKIRVIVFNEPSLSGEFFVNANGNLSLPLIGDVRAVGTTTSSLAEVIQAKLADGYLRQPRVSIDVLTFRPFYILGEVNKPGKYAYSSGLTVLNAVATAEGFTYRANKKTVFLKRAGEAKEIKVRLSPDLRVLPGDTIRIRERFF